MAEAFGRPAVVTKAAEAPSVDVQQTIRAALDDMWEQAQEKGENEAAWETLMTKSRQDASLMTDVHTYNLPFVPSKILLYVYNFLSRLFHSLSFTLSCCFPLYLFFSL
jgi:hypothetical protein